VSGTVLFLLYGLNAWMEVVVVYVFTKISTARRGHGSGRWPSCSFASAVLYVLSMFIIFECIENWCTTVYKKHVKKGWYAFMTGLLCHCINSNVALACESSDATTVAQHVLKLPRRERRKYSGRNAICVLWTVVKYIFFFSEKEGQELQSYILLQIVKGLEGCMFDMT
jgi:hypothetical protein